MTKKVGDPCPKCAAKLIRRRSNFRRIVGDVAYCAPCGAAFELAEEEPTQTLFAPAPAFSW